MDDAVLMQILIAADELLHYEDGLRLGHLLAFFEDILEGPFVAELLKKVDVVG